MTQRPANDLVPRLAASLGRFDRRTDRAGETAAFEAERARQIAAIRRFMAERSKRMEPSTPSKRFQTSTHPKGPK